jgi:peptidoglycan/xylan/chitin deacetylase (PgdA/CDA1 family)
LRKSLLVPFLALACLCAAAEPVTFTGLDLSASDRLLFAAAAGSPEAGPYSTLFLAEAGTRAIRQLTFFPEGVLLLQDGQSLQVQNRFGVFRTGPGFRGLSAVSAFPSFVGGSPVQAGSLAPMGASPGGRYLLFLRPRSPAYGELAIQEVETGQETVISERIELSLSELPAAWSPDGRFLVYGKGTALYYFSLSQLATGRVPAESLRRIGDGRITSVQWGADGGLYYVSGRSVSVIDPTELFTRALYSGLLAIGRIVGEIPFAFDPLFDSFRVSPDGRFLLFNKGGRNLLLTGLSTVGAGEPVQLPHLALPRGATVRAVIWPVGGALTILCQVRTSGTLGTAVYRLARDGQGRYSSFARTADEGVRDIVLSPDAATVALVRADDVAWKDYASWVDRGRTAHPSPLHVLWLSPDELLIAGARYTERWSIASSRSALVALSQPGDYGWASAGGQAVQARVDGRPFAFDEQAGSWAPAAAFAVRDRSLASGNFRVYLEPAAGGPWAMVPMIRDVKGWGTTALVPPAAAVAEPFPAEEPVDFGNFAHGSRTRRREVSLVFNVVESDEGLTEVLNTLSARGLRATFFVNGEFIRRHPAAVREIADSGHEVGSLFYASFNLTDARLTVDAEFIRAGLARNEDDYHAATGRELSLLWHAPYYIVNSAIIAAAAEMGYLYAGRDIDPLDWVSRTDSNTSRGIYFPAADLVERIAAEKKPGSIIPVQVGTTGEARDDYLFQKLDLVVSELARQGFAVVPVSTLVEHAR